MQTVKRNEERLRLVSGVGGHCIADAKTRPCQAEQSDKAFKHLKYSSNFLDRLASFEDALAFCREFSAWYNGLAPPLRPRLHQVDAGRRCFADDVAHGGLLMFAHPALDFHIALPLQTLELRRVVEGR